MIDRLRKRRKKIISDEELTEIGRPLTARGEGGGNPEAAFEKSEDAKLLYLAMEAMDPLFKNVLVLREIEDLSYEEIALILRVGIGTVKSRIFRARGELKKQFLALTQVGTDRTK